MTFVFHYDFIPSIQMTQFQISSRPTLLFIPDISGFTRFVTDTEITHSQHIIEELLEVLIDANNIGLEISEIEGDAILFYRYSDELTAAEILTQVRTMFVQFHAHLKKFESQRICNCGGVRHHTFLAAEIRRSLRTDEREERETILKIVWR